MDTINAAINDERNQWTPLIDAINAVNIHATLMQH